MKQGETAFLKCPLINLDIGAVNEVIFTMKDLYGNIVTLAYPNEVAYVEDAFLLPLNQEDTLALKGKVRVEAQINYKDLSVKKSNIENINIGDTLATEIVEGNTPSGSDEGIELSLEEVKIFFETDKTLTLADRPADAKASGDRIKELEAQVELLTK